MFKALHCNAGRSHAATARTARGGWFLGVLVLAWAIAHRPSPIARRAELSQPELSLPELSLPELSLPELSLVTITTRTVIENCHRELSQKKRRRRRRRRRRRKKKRRKKRVTRKRDPSERGGAALARRPRCITSPCQLSRYRGSHPARPMPCPPIHGNPPASPTNYPAPCRICTARAGHP